MSLIDLCSAYYVISKQCMIIVLLTAQVINSHYAAVSADSKYRQSNRLLLSLAATLRKSKFSVRWSAWSPLLQELICSHTAWFLRLSAPVFAAPLTQLFNQSIRYAVVPQQWKKAWITPTPKVAHPTEASDYRPISITPVLSRMLERHVARTYIYPALQQPPPGLHIGDQFALRPVGSTDAALITLLHTTFNILSTRPLVCAFALNFSNVWYGQALNLFGKAFPSGATWCHL